MANYNSDPIEANWKDSQEQDEPNPTPIQELSMKDLLNTVHYDYRQVKRFIMRTILVLNDKTKGIMVRDRITTIGDYMSGNDNDNLINLCKKLQSLDQLLNTSLGYIEWLLLHIEELEKVEKILQENVRDQLSETKTIAYFENTLKDISMKTAIAVPTISRVVGGVEGSTAPTVTRVGIHAGFTSIVAILASAGIGGLAGSQLGTAVTGCLGGVGTAATGCLGGIATGTAAIWLSKANQIGKERKGKFEEFVEMDNSLDKQEVLPKVSLVSDKFGRIVRQVKDIVDKGYNIEENKRGDDRQRDKAVEQYKNVYCEMLDDPNFQELPEEQKNKKAKFAAENACKAVLENDLVYGNEENFEKFLRERIQIPDGSESLGGGTNRD